MHEDATKTAAARCRNCGHTGPAESFPINYTSADGGEWETCPGCGSTQVHLERDETTHTPGPWKVWREWPDQDPNIPRRFHIHTGDASNPADPQYRRIAATTDMPEHVAEANARLIAAAPELLKLAHYMVGYADNGNLEADVSGDLSGIMERVEMARDAIAKAEGGDPR